MSLDQLAGLHALGRIHLEDRLVERGVERLADRIQGAHTFAPEVLAQALGGELHPRGPGVRCPGLGGAVHGAVEVVEGLHDLEHDALLRDPAGFLGVASRPAAVVLQLGLGAQPAVA